MANRRTDLRMRELALKWIEETISEEEKEEFNRWYQSMDDPDSGNIITSGEFPEDLRERLYQSILEREKIKQRRHPRLIKFRYYITAAAVSLIFLATGGYFYFTRPSGTIAVTVLPHKPQVIIPGGNKAVLTLADGSQVILDTSRTGVLAIQGGSSVRKSKDGQVVYEATDKSYGESQVALNTITTPRGGEYQVILPDGSKVWLNAASSLTFPAFFTGKERRVELTGEAYFEVAENSKQPFRVTISSTEVEVLGTHFNIMGYPDESSVNTTLLEGSVKVRSGDKSRLIHPGQQARSGDGLEVSDVDAEQAVAWKKGYFSFNNENIQVIMRKIARWYNVDIEYRGNIAKKTFGGTISKFENVSEVLKVMELTDVIHFKIEERRVIVMP